VFLVGVRGGGRSVVALLQGPAGLFPAAGLRAGRDDARACLRRLAARRICARAAPLYPDPGGAQARHQCLRGGGGQEFLRAQRPRFQGITRAGLLFLENYGSGRRPQGASTITQQVAKNFLLTNEATFSRKIREALLALKIERTFSKQKILELYLNEIYLAWAPMGWRRRRSCISTSRCTS